jgi:ferredoxin
VLPREVLDAEIETLRKMGAEFRLGVKLTADAGAVQALTLGCLAAEFDAVLLACGPIDLAAAKALGLATAAKGVKVDPATLLTSVDKVFAAGAMVTPYKLSVRAVGDGHAAAGAIDAYLRGDKKPPAREFSVRLGTLSEQEMAVYLADAGADGRIPKPLLPSPGLTVEEAILEARRCLQCGCIKARTCSLRVLATDLGANMARYRGDRRTVERCNSHPEIVYEPGKCISCGRCVAIATEAGEEYGLTQVKRGFGVRIEPGLGVTLQSALAKSAAKVVAACPTAALAWKRDCGDCGGCSTASNPAHTTASPPANTLSPATAS